MAVVAGLSIDEKSPYEHGPIMIVASVVSVQQRMQGKADPFNQIAIFINLMKQMLTAQMLFQAALQTLSWRVSSIADMVISTFPFALLENIVAKNTLGALVVKRQDSDLELRQAQDIDHCCN